PHMPGAFRGIIDLVGMKLLTFTPESLGKEVVEGEIPDDLIDEAKLYRDQMLEKLYDYSNELMELALAEEQVPDQLVRQVLREATTHRLVVPVLCGSALDHVGIQPLLDAVGHYLPSPLDRPPVKGTDPSKPDKELVRKPSNDEPFCGLVFKVVADKHGDLHFVRIYSGVLKANTRAYNPGKDKKENVAQLWHVQASRKEQVPQAETGDIVGIIGLRNSVTGDTLCDAKQPILLESIQFPETVIAMAIEPETSAERKKLADTLEMLKRQDPTFRASTSEETGQTIISGMGELHLEVIKHRLLRDFNLNVKVKKPQVSYRETIKEAVEVIGECNQHLAGQLLFARVTIRMEPQRTGDRAVTVLPGKSDGLPPEFLPAVLDALTQEAEGGGSLGYPLMKVKITVLGGETSETGSN
ncbi:MAG: EF-Tu/IF-2/RF-3 family GTPase, partial [Pirellulales bacterium]